MVWSPPSQHRNSIVTVVVVVVVLSNVIPVTVDVSVSVPVVGSGSGYNKVDLSRYLNRRRIICDVSGSDVRVCHLKKTMQRSPPFNSTTIADFRS